MAYEVIGEEYLNDNVGLKLRNFLNDCDKDLHDLLENYGIKCDLTVNHNEIEKCMGTVLETANVNTERKVHGDVLLPTSDGNYLHQIIFLFIEGNMFIKINLFKVYGGCVCISEEGYNYIENLPIVEEIDLKDIKIIKIIQTVRTNGEKFTNII